METRKGFDTIPKIHKSSTSVNINQKINSGVYKAEFATRAKAYNLQGNESEVNSLISRMKSSYEIELRYAHEYISVLRKKIAGNAESFNEKKLRDDISGLFEQLKYEQENNLKLLEKLSNKNPDSRKDEPTVSDESKLKFIKQEFNKSIEDCLGFYVRELKKGEEKIERLELNLDLLKKEVKVIKGVLLVNYKNDLNDKNEEIRENKENLNRVIEENEGLREKLKDLQKDVFFYQEENRKQRLVIQEISEENEIERNVLNSIQKLKNQEYFSFEKDEFYNEMIEKVQETCETCEKFDEKLKKKEKSICELKGEIERVKKENLKLAEDNQNLELITSKMQDMIICNDSRSLENGSTSLFSPRRTHDSFEYSLKEKSEYKSQRMSMKSPYSDIEFLTKDIS